MISINTLKASSAFMGACEEDQSNSLYRVLRHCREHNFKSVHATIMQKQVLVSKSARKEVEKFEKLLDSEGKWPIEMEQIRDNLLRTTLMDEELEGSS